MNEDIIICHDLTHPEEDRAPFCTKIANKDNLVEGHPDLGPDMYFCDACFGVGNSILNAIFKGIEEGKVTAEQMSREFRRAKAEQDAKPIKKGKN